MQDNIFHKADSELERNIHKSETMSVYVSIKAIVFGNLEEDLPRTQR